MSFFIGSLIISLSATVVSAKTLFGYNKIRLVYKIVGTVLIAFGWFTPFIVAFMARKFPDIGRPLWTTAYIGYTLCGFSFILFCLLMGRDLIWFSSYLTAKILKRENKKYHPKNPESYPLLNKTNLICVIAAVLLTGYALFEGSRLPPEKEVVVASDKIEGTLTVVQLSDLHINRFTSAKHLKQIVDKTNALTPDLIVLTGDIFDDSFDLIQKTSSELSALKAAYGVYMVWGNHEFYHDIPRRGRDIKKLGVSGLHNVGRNLTRHNVYLAGIDFPVLPEKKLQDVYKNKIDGEFVLLLSHYPAAFDKPAGENADLILSGHTHGGQIFPFHFMAKRMNGYLAGMYEKKNGARLYVSRGTGLWGPPLRLLAPPEITVIKLTGVTEDR